MMRRFLPLGVLAGIAIPLTTLAAMSKSSEVLRLLSWTNIPNTYSVEVHGGSQGMYISAWAKGMHHGGDSMTMKGNGVLTVDIAEPTEGMHMRLRTEFLYTDGMAYLKPSVEGTLQDTLISLNGGAQSKVWGFVNIPEEFDMEQPEDSAVEIFGHALRSHGIEVSDEEMNAAINDLLDGMFITEMRGGEYSVRFKEHAADEIMTQIMVFFGRITKDPEGMAGFAPSSQEALEMRTLLDSTAMHFRVRFDGQNKPAFTKIYMAAETPDGWISMQGTAEKLSSPLSVSVPTGAVPVEEFLGIFDHIDGMFDGFDLPIGPSDDHWMDADSDMMTDDEMTWEDIEGMQWDAIEGDADMMPQTDDCTANSAESIQMLRKGMTCDRQVRSRRHLQR